MKQAVLTQSNYNVKEISKKVPVKNYKNEDFTWQDYNSSTAYKHLIRSSHYAPHFDLLVGVGPHALRMSDRITLNMDFQKGLLVSNYHTDTNNSLKVRLIKNDPKRLSHIVIRTDTTLGYISYLWYKTGVFFINLSDRVIKSLYFKKPKQKNKLHSIPYDIHIEY